MRDLAEKRPLWSRIIYIDIPLPENGDLIDTILSHYENHASILAIQNMNLNATFSLELADDKDIKLIMERLETSKATGIDTIPGRLVKTSANVTHKHLHKF